jgi:RHS repeat-associated protein
LYSFELVYNAEYDRAKMVIADSGTTVLTRWYVSGSYMVETVGSTTTEYTYIGGDAYTAPVVAVTSGGNTNYFYLLRDYLGNITHKVNTSNTVVAEYSYDAWGRRRNPTDWSYDLSGQPELFAGRGFTAHEELPWFNLINMNGRLYDPHVGRFLNVDNLVQNPLYSQCFNRYSYCVNNPLKYNDKDGQFFWLPIIIGAFLFGTGNTIIHANRGDIHNFWDGLGYFAQGAATGAVAGATWSLGFAGISSSNILAQIGGYTILSGKAVNAITTVASGINNSANAWSILMGKAYTDENRSFFGGLWQGVSRYT